MAESAYSFSLTTFSPSGKLVQIEYALNAVAGGATSLGVKAKNGVVIATEKKLPSVLIDETSMQKILTLTPNIAVVYSGMGPDFRVLCRKGRKAAQQYYRVYREVIPVTMLVRELAAVMQEFTQRGGVRPFGISLLLAGYDHNGPQLFQIDPSGSYFAWKASAVGKHMVNAKTFLEKRYNDDLELEDAVHTALLTLKEGFEGAMDHTNIELDRGRGQGVQGADARRDQGLLGRGRVESARAASTRRARAAAGPAGASARARALWSYSQSIWPSLAAREGLQQLRVCVGGTRRGPRRLAFLITVHQQFFIFYSRPRRAGGTRPAHAPARASRSLIHRPSAPAPHLRRPAARPVPPARVRGAPPAARVAPAAHCHRP